MLASLLLYPSSNYFLSIAEYSQLGILTMKISFYTKDKEIVEISGTVDESGKLSLNAILGDVKITTQGQISDTREATGTYSFEREGKVIKGEFHGKKTGEVSQQAPVNAIGLGAILGAIFGK